MVEQREDGKSALTIDSIEPGRAVLSSEVSFVVKEDGREVRLSMSLRTEYGQTVEGGRETYHALVVGVVQEDGNIENWFELRQNGCSRILQDVSANDKDEFRARIQNAFVRYATVHNRFVGLAKQITEVGIVSTNPSGLFNLIQQILDGNY